MGANRFGIAREHPSLALAAALLRIIREGMLAAVLVQTGERCADSGFQGLLAVLIHS